MKGSMRKNILRRSRAACLAVCMAGAVLISPFGITTVKASPLDDGELWIGNTQVTDENCADIFGDGTASYDPDTMTLTLNGVHIGPDNYYFKDYEYPGDAYDEEAYKEYNNWGMHSLYAKDTVAHLVINGNNTFQAPVVERYMYERGIAGYDDHDSMVTRQLEIWVGMIIDSSGLDVNPSITGSGTLKSYTPAIKVEDTFDTAKREGGLTLVGSGQGGVGLYWNIGDATTMTIGTPGGEGPTLDLRGGVAGLSLYGNGSWGPSEMNITTKVYNSDLTLQALQGDGYGTYYSPHAEGFQAHNVILEENTILRTNGKGNPGSANNDVMNNSNKYTNNIAPLSVDDEALSWTDENPFDGEIWAVFGTAKQMESGNYWTPGNSYQDGKKSDIDPKAEDYADTDIDVLGFTRGAIVYSVDVEWGAMTFQYENSTWDATEHMTVAGAGWKVYDSVENEALDSTTDTINRIQVTNHSNASVWATLEYTGAADYEDTTGSFDIAEDDEVTDFDVTGNYLFLDTANNATEKGKAGTATVGTVYFMPSGIKEEYKRADGIAKWSQLGTITVGIVTEEP